MEDQATHHVIPCSDNGLHIKIAWEEGHNSIWHNFTVFHQNASKITNDCRVVSHFKSRTNGDLVTPASDDLRAKCDILNCHMSRKNALRTRGRNAFLVSVMGYVSCTTGVNWSILGYMSSGEMVPEVMTTLLNRSNTGLMARDGSKHLQHSSE